MVKNFLAMQKAQGLITGLGGFPGEGNGHTERSLMGHRPWDHKQSDTTEQLTLSVFTFKG